MRPNPAHSELPEPLLKLDIHVGMMMIEHGALTTQQEERISIVMDPTLATNARSKKASRMRLVVSDA